MRNYRPDDALLAGVCAELARRLGWNVWAVRCLFLFGLVLKPLWVGLVYLVLALAMGLVLGHATPRKDEPTRDAGLKAPEMSERARRIEALEQKFRDLESGRDRP